MTPGSPRADKKGDLSPSLPVLLPGEGLEKATGLGDMVAGRNGDAADLQDCACQVLSPLERANE